MAARRWRRKTRVALAGTINKPLPGGQIVVNYKWDDYYVFMQDEWRVHPNLTLSLGVRYELPGNAVESLADLNGQIMTIAGNDPRLRIFTEVISVLVKQRAATELPTVARSA